MKRSVVVGAFLALATACSVPQLNGQSSGVNVATWHNDNWRTGQNTSETTLTTGSFANNGFGLLCKIKLRSSPQQEEVYAQPLVVANANGGTTVYVASMQDSVYVFNVPAKWTAQTCAQLQATTPVSLLRRPLAGQYPADVCLIGNGSTDTNTCTRVVCPSVGILGTPAIDATTNTWSFRRSTTTIEI